MVYFLSYDMVLGRTLDGRPISVLFFLYIAFNPVWLLDLLYYLIIPLTLSRRLGRIRRLVPIIGGRSVPRDLWDWSRKYDFSKYTALSVFKGL